MLFVACDDDVSCLKRSDGTLRNVLSLIYRCANEET